MSTLKTSFARCRHCDASVPAEAATPGPGLICPTCGGAIDAVAPKPARILTDDDVLAILGPPILDPV
jgi:hypothetical protein